MPVLFICTRRSSGQTFWSGSLKKSLKLSVDSHFVCKMFHFLHFFPFITSLLHSYSSATLNLSVKITHSEGVTSFIFYPRSSSATF
jgi:hypothetical protein